MKMAAFLGMKTIKTIFHKKKYTTLAIGFKLRALSRFERRGGIRVFAPWQAPPEGMGGAFLQFGRK